TLSQASQASAAAASHSSSSQVMTLDLIELLEWDAAAALAWDAWDNVHDHCGCTAISRWGQLALDSNTNTYSPKKRFYSNAQITAFVPAGWYRIVADDNNPSMRVTAFSNDSATQLTIVGYNPDSNPT